MTKKDKVKKPKKDKNIKISNKNNINIKINTDKPKRKYTRRKKTTDTSKAMVGYQSGGYTPIMVSNPIIPPPPIDYEKMSRDYLNPTKINPQNNLLLTGGTIPLALPSSVPSVKTPSVPSIKNILKKPNKKIEYTVAGLMKVKTLKLLKKEFEDEGVSKEFINSLTSKTKKNAINMFVDYQNWLIDTKIVKGTQKSFKDYLDSTIRLAPAAPVLTPVPTTPVLTPVPTPVLTPVPTPVLTPVLASVPTPAPTPTPVLTPITTKKN